MRSTPKSLDSEQRGERADRRPSAERVTVRGKARIGGRPPNLPRSFLARRRLEAHLDRATVAPVTLLVAPAGAGKTVGVGGWAMAAGGAVGGDPVAGDAVWVQADASWDAPRLEAQLLLAEDPSSDRPRLVIIDDAHQLPPSAVRLIDDRLNAAPSSMRLLLLSRWDLPLTRTIPELLGHLNVLRGDVLRMDDAEVAFLVAAHARTSDPAVVEAITDRAHGWCAAVVLTSRAVASSNDPAATAQRYARDPGGVAGQVASEVFASLQSRERHLLLCLAGEETVTVATATSLTHDAGAGEVLGHLAATGLLVTRLDGASVEGPLVQAPDARFRIHPLLMEVVRRRLTTGGVDVERARGTVRRAVLLDLTRGQLGDGFRRLVTAGDFETAAGVLATEGIAMVNRGQVAAIADFIRDHADVVDAHPETWPAVLTERWVAGDTDAARHWSDRLHDAGAVTTVRDADLPLVTALVELIRARLGLAALPAATALAQATTADAQRFGAGYTSDHSMLPQLLAELGIVQTWSGDLIAGERNLSAALELTKTRDLPALAISATSHLAFTEYLLGREQTCVEVAAQALRLIEGSTGWRPSFAAERATLVLTLAELAAPPGPTPPVAPPTRPTPAHPADLLTRFFTKIRDARLAAGGGSVAAALVILEAPFDFPLAQPLPLQLAVTLHVERAFLAFLTGDSAVMRTAERELLALDATGALALVAALRADLTGDLRRATTLSAAAADDAASQQPPVRALALATHAQLLAATGEYDEALARLREAVTETSTRRNAMPFLGWARHGARCGALLAALADQDRPPSDSWLALLRHTFDDRADIAGAYAHTVPTAEERRTAPAPLPAVTLSLSPRERDVLLHLARGATYTDIAANLVVSENTVKTHVSSLYSKLGVSRRRDALLLARDLHLI